LFHPASARVVRLRLLRWFRNMRGEANYKSDEKREKSNEGGIAAAKE
jgi:hypothetical protein